MPASGAEKRVLHEVRTVLRVDDHGRTTEGVVGLAASNGLLGDDVGMRSGRGTFRMHDRRTDIARPLRIDERRLDRQVQCDRPARPPALRLPSARPPAPRRPRRPVRDR